jgi:membrane glycosyltransferase
MVNKTLFWWVAVIVIPLLFAVPISVLCSYSSLGMAFRRAGIFLTPVWVCSQSGKDTADIRALQSVGYLHAKESETNIP